MDDVFNSASFSTLSLTTAVNRLPYKPSRLGAMGLFQGKGISTLSVAFEEENGKLALVEDVPRGSGQAVAPDSTRRLFSMPCRHLPLNKTLLADDMQGVRAFGSETETEVWATKVNDKLTEMRQHLEVTLEYHRVSALRGLVMQNDGSTVLQSLFTLLGVAEQTFNFDFGLTSGVPNQDMKKSAIAVKRLVEGALGNLPYDHIHAMCSDGFFDDFVSHPTVAGAFEKYQEGRFTLSDNRKGFEFAGIVWENYSGSVGSVPFIPANTARFFPVGVPGMFKEIWAPANYAETVNTIGKQFYAKIAPMKFDTGAELQVQSNPLCYCEYPRALVKGY